ncbi:MAG TPA: four helix bundle protein [Pyrinomonadaceae bacterium]|nr:four helix bundle protein [Pyrinomonadaceae bacterium]
MGSKSYRDLLVWQKGISLCTQVYKICETFPKTELYGLSDQMKRSAVSIPSNIAEGQGRQHPGEFLHFISIANGSLAELDTQRIIAENLNFISHEKSTNLDNSITEVRKMLYALTQQLKTKN